MSFSNVIFGKCKVCGADGGDNPSASGANSSSNLVSSSNGVPLEYYQGELMCELCIKRKIADAESQKTAESHAEEERFRQEAGFNKTIS